MAGLAAARVLCDRFERVTLIERDELPEGESQRRGVPQGRHTHALLESGRRVLETLYPGLSAQLETDGAVVGDSSADARWFLEGGPLKRSPLGTTAFLLSRPFLESRVRARTLALPNLECLQATHVDGLATSGDPARVDGVRIGGETIPADLTVDATGKGSKSRAWLEAMGYAPPEEERVEVGVRYTTRLFRRDPSDFGGDAAAVIPPTPRGKRGGVMLAQEGGRWTVTLIGYFGQGAPEDLDGFVAYAKSLPAPYVHEVVSRAEPVGEARSAKFPASRRNRYERLRRFPEGYLVMGDALCCFNPIYGQGMSSAALQAAELGRTLDEGGDAKSFFMRAAKVVDNPWSIATGSDLRMPEAEGPRTPMLRFVNWYMAKLHRAAHADVELAWAFLRVAALTAPPQSMLHPRLLMRVAAGWVRRTR